MVLFLTTTLNAGNSLSLPEKEHATGAKISNFNFYSGDLFKQSTNTQRHVLLD